MEVPLDPEIEKIVLRKVELGEYPSVVHLFEEALYLLMQRDWSQSQQELQGRNLDAFNSAASDDANEPNP